MDNTPCDVTRRMKADKEGKPSLSSLGLITKKAERQRDERKTQRRCRMRSVGELEKKCVALNSKTQSQEEGVDPLS